MKQVCPSVQALPKHLENGHVPFKEGKEVMAVEESPPNMELTMWFTLQLNKRPIRGTMGIVSRLPKKACVE